MTEHRLVDELNAAGQRIKLDELCENIPYRGLYDSVRYLQLLLICAPSL